MLKSLKSDVNPVNHLVPGSSKYNVNPISSINHLRSPRPGYQKILRCYSKTQYLRQIHFKRGTKNDGYDGWHLKSHTWSAGHLSRHRHMLYILVDPIYFKKVNSNLLYSCTRWFDFNPIRTHMLVSFPVYPKLVLSKGHYYRTALFADTRKKIPDP